MLKQMLKRIYWSLPISSDVKNKLSAMRYERKLKNEAVAEEANQRIIISPTCSLSDYSEYILGGYGKRSDSYCNYCEHQNSSSDVTLIAYYLTQFHPNPQNDEWWGKGTTEWNNVDQAIPQFVGHYQPRRPGELGYYDLRIDDVMRRQIKIAQNYGIGAFCFYYYWFNGKRLLEYPLNKFLQDHTYAIPFFYCWANENWTKRYSGTSSEVLMEIDPTVESYQAFIDSVISDFSDPRYFKIGNRPVLSVYRPALVPDTEKVLDHWRKRVKITLGLDLYIIAIQEKDTSIDWLSKGYDAESEFQPKSVELWCKDISTAVRPIRSDFSGVVFDYADLVDKRRYLNNKGLSRKTYPAVMPMWDNTARRNHRGTIFHGSTPVLYQKWLHDIVQRVRRNADLDERIVFINAWNEWGEGAYLEPDRFFGYAYLEATWNALRNDEDFE